MAKKYKTPNDEPQMANEPAVASYNSSVALNNNISSSSFVGVKPYTVEELDSHLEESEMQFKTGRFLTMEEADRDFVEVLQRICH